MNLAELTPFIPPIAAGCYTILLVVAFTRRERQDRQTETLLAFLAVSILWEFLTYFTRVVPYLPSIPAKALLLGTTLLGAMTAVFINWSQRRLWLLSGGLAIIVSVLLDIYLPTVANIPYGSRAISYSDLFTALAWLILSSLILTRVWREYRRISFPWHANRLLFWIIVLLLTFTGEALLFFLYSGLTLAGQIIRFMGVAGLTYAISSHRIVDVRTRSQSAIAFIIIAVVSALPLAGILMVLEPLTHNQPILTIIIITLGLILYAPFQRLIERLFYKFLAGESVDTSQVLRHYSQSIYQILDVQQLSREIVNALSDLLTFRQGALMLVTGGKNGYEIEPIPALGSISPQKQHIPTNSIFIKSLSHLHQPLLQYELDFNRDYAGIAPPVREWLNRMAMDVYVPVNAGETLEGLIAIGPKASGVPYQPGELELMQVLADQTVIALQNARLYSRLNRQNDENNRLKEDYKEQNEQLKEIDRKKTEFVTIASHELRTPLTQVKGYADILHSMNDEGPLERDQTRTIIGYINRASDRLDTLITDMLDASQLDIEGFRMAFTKTKLDMIVRMATEPLTEALKERHINWITEGLEDIPSMFADFKRLVQAFTNLIGNSIKYTPDYGTVTLRVGLVPGQGDLGDHIEIVLADEGIGIDAKFHELIFEKFFRIGDPQLHSTGSTKFKGAGPGLGLHIAKGVIEGHGGRIWVESAGEDEERLPGSEFHIILPVRPPEINVHDAILTQGAGYLVG
ncbi:MAG: hypothetical protein GY803_18645 [Chloroflexi bacterium]|nr:hypothetical protein [Chloroflexota bacterium]